MKSFSEWFHSRAQLGLFVALLATLCYSLKPIIIKMIYLHDVTSVSVLAWRMIISLPIYIGVGIWLWMPKNKDVRPSINKQSKPWIVKSMVLGVVGYYLAAMLDLEGLQYISSQLARLILFTYPTLVAILGWMIFRQRLSKTVVFALVVSYIGVGLIFIADLDQLGDQVMLGSLLMFLSVLAFSLYVLLSKTIIDQVGGNAFTVVAMLASSVFVLIHYLVVMPSWDGLSISVTAFWLIFIMTIVTTVVPSFLMAAAIGYIGPQKTAIAGTFGPAATSIFAVFMLNESFGWPQFLGLVLVVVAISFMQRDAGK